MEDQNKKSFFFDFLRVSKNRKEGDRRPLQADQSAFALLCAYSQSFASVIWPPTASCYFVVNFKSGKKKILSDEGKNVELTNTRVLHKKMKLPNF